MRMLHDSLVASNVLINSNYSILNVDGIKKQQSMTSDHCKIRCKTKLCK